TESAQTCSLPAAIDATWKSAPDVVSAASKTGRSSGGSGGPVRIAGPSMRLAAQQRMVRALVSPQITSGPAEIAASDASGIGAGGISGVLAPDSGAMRGTCQQYASPSIVSPHVTWSAAAGAVKRNGVGSSGTTGSGSVPLRPPHAASANSAATAAKRRDGRTGARTGR